MMHNSMSALAALQAQKYLVISAFVALIYDHLITLSEEVEYIWKRGWSTPSVLFLLNRYGTPIEITAVIIALDNKWSHEICRRFVKMEGIGAAATTGVSQLIMILRVYALYLQSKYLLSLLLAVLCVQFTLQLVATARGTFLPVPTGCILVGPRRFFSVYWIAPLVTDTCVFLLTLWNTLRLIRWRGRTPMIELFVRDGTIYFLLIFTANFMNVVTYLTAEPDLQAIFAPFSQVITSIMISRLVLNLRGFLHDPKQDIINFDVIAGAAPRPLAARMHPWCNEDSLSSSVQPPQRTGQPADRVAAGEVWGSYIPISWMDSTRARRCQTEECPLACLASAD